MATNQLTSDGIEVGQTLVVAADTPKTTAVASDAIATAQTPAVPAQVQLRRLG